MSNYAQNLANLHVQQGKGMLPSQAFNNSTAREKYVATYTGGKK